jgi:hypothetical protein
LIGEDDELMSKKQCLKLKELRNEYFKRKDEVLESLMTISKTRETNFTFEELKHSDCLVVFSGYQDLNAKFRNQI